MAQHLESNDELDLIFQDNLFIHKFISNINKNADDFVGGLVGNKSLLIFTGYIEK